MSEMDAISLIFWILGLFLLAYMLFFGTVGLLVAAIANHIQSGKLKKAQEALQNVGRLKGVISDAALVQDNSAHPLHYKYSVQYTDIYGQVRRAFIGISTNQPLGYAVGMPVSLVQLSAPVLDVPAEVLDPNRGANGMLPDKIRFRLYHGVPVDETATLMFEDDYNNLYETLGTKSQKLEKISKVTLVLGIIALVLFAASVFGLIALFNVDTSHPL